MTLICSLPFSHFIHMKQHSFQARCMASKTPKIATIGCAIAGCLTFVVGIPFAYLGAITRVYYGPDSAHASFETDVSLVLLSAFSYASTS